MGNARKAFSAAFWKIDGIAHPNGTQIIAQGFGMGGRWINEKLLQRFYIAVLLAILPIAVYLLFGKPVGLLQTAGAIEAAHNSDRRRTDFIPQSSHVD